MVVGMLLLVLDIAQDRWEQAEVLVPILLIALGYNIMFQREVHVSLSA